MLHLTSCLLGLQSVTVSGLSLFFMMLTVLRRTGQVFCRMPLSLGLSNIFLMVRLGL